MTLRAAAPTAAATVLLLLSGCTTEPDPYLASASDQRQRYVDAQGSVESIPESSRGQPIMLSGTTLGGEEWSLASVPSDEIVLVTVWGSWCGPCRTQLAEVETASRQLRAQDVGTQVVGLDFMEDADEGRSFQIHHWLDFPSLRYEGGRVLQAIPESMPTVPTTLVLDSTRRIAARVVGTTDADTLTRLVTTVQPTG